ncbi:thaumatin family protein [Streptomyces sp. NPDC008150]|uniref:thaumatin family protein n=1 Tax=Streptomyces sp. NPDC008150 TaxID=3364816 RepID=UPI0036E9ACE1
MARSGRHATRPARQRRWYAAGAALTVLVTALVTYVAWPPSGGGVPDPAADGAIGTRVSAAASARDSDPASPSPTATRTRRASAGASPRPSASRTGSPRAAATAAPSTGVAGAPAGQRVITMVNHTAQTVWAVATDTAAYPAGRRLAPGQSTSVTVAGNWGGRIWGRTGCVSSAAGTCAGGDCTSVCEGANPPTTLGEFSFAAYAGLDFYDVSMVDGSNLPMFVNISHTTTTDPVDASGCYRGTCTSEVDCPAAMRQLSGGQPIGCKPPCAAFGGDTYCCRGAWAGRENCVPSKWPVDYTQVFKKAEPYAYSYAFDDAATMSCKGACYYRVTFGTS